MIWTWISRKMKPGISVLAKILYEFNRLTD
jgi:hypothetical protein